MPPKPIPAICVAALAVCAAALTSCSSDSTPCGPTIDRSGGGHWVCTFADDFDGSSLDPARWQAITTATTGFTQASHECYVDDPAHVRVGGGLLTLTATRLSAPAPCGRLATPYRSGLVSSKDRFAQTYGRFEVRAKLPLGAGFQPALWMYPQDLAYGDRSGEIDIAESFGAPNTVSPHMHMRDATAADHPQGADCHVENASGSFHTYAVEWTPDELAFIYDGVPCLTIHGWQPAPPLVAPQPFDKPFFMLLQLGLGYGPNAPGASTPFPGRLEIDYVRAWR